jgi:transcriptional regulator with XRE-family HTH domain
MELYIMTIGQILKMIRINKKLSQKDMADLLGISQNYLSQIESNRKEPSQDKLEEFAKSLKISKEALLIATTDVPIELNEKERNEFHKLQKNIVSLLVFELTGVLEKSA